MAAVMIVVQTPFQRDAMRQKFGRDCHLIKNPIDPGDAALYCTNGAAATALLWAKPGGKSVQKRPELLLELARRCPEIPFVMVTNRIDAKVYDMLANAVPRWSQRLSSRLHMRKWTSITPQARVFVSTTAFEGFPNTFLQAGKHGVPVLSLDVDPDGFISRE